MTDAVSLQPFLRHSFHYNSNYPSSLPVSYEEIPYTVEDRTTYRPWL